jgi:hypothetical protein
MAQVLIGEREVNGVLPAAAWEIVQTLVTSSQTIVNEMENSFI